MAALQSVFLSGFLIVAVTSRRLTSVHTARNIGPTMSRQPVTAEDSVSSLRGGHYDPTRKVLGVRGDIGPEAEPETDLVPDAEEKKPFKLITVGSCKDADYYPIRDEATCKQAAEFLESIRKIPFIRKKEPRIVDNPDTHEAAKPEGCFLHQQKELVISTHPDSRGHGAETSTARSSRYPICQRRPNGDEDELQTKPNSSPVSALVRLCPDDCDGCWDNDRHPMQCLSEASGYRNTKQHFCEKKNGIWCPAQTPAPTDPTPAPTAPHLPADSVVGDGDADRDPGPHNFCHDPKGIKFVDKYKDTEIPCGPYHATVSKHISYGYQGITTLVKAHLDGEGDQSKFRTLIMKVDKRPAKTTHELPSNMRQECAVQEVLRKANVSVPKCHAFCEFDGHEIMLMDFIPQAVNIDIFFRERKYPEEGPKKSHGRKNTSLPPSVQTDDVGKRAAREMFVNLYRMLHSGYVNHDQFWKNILVETNGHVHFIDMGFATTADEVRTGKSAVSRIPGMNFDWLQKTTISSVMQSISREYLRDAFDSTKNELALLPSHLRKKVQKLAQYHINWRNKHTFLHKLKKSSRMLAHDLGGPDGPLSFLFLSC